MNWKRAIVRILMVIQGFIAGGVLAYITAKE